MEEILIFAGMGLVAWFLLQNAGLLPSSSGSGSPITPTPSATVSTSQPTTSSSGPANTVQTATPVTTAPPTTAPAATISAPTQCTPAQSVLSDAQLLAAVQPSGVDSTTWNQTDANPSSAGPGMLSEIANMQLWASPVTCAGFTPNSQLTLEQAASLASTAASTGTSVAAATGLILGSSATLIGAGIAVVGAVVSAIFSHHAAAVREENQLLCAAIPAFNNTLSVLAQAMQSGQISCATYGQALEQTYSEFVQMLAPITQNCNAACYYNAVARAIISKIELRNGLPPGGPTSGGGGGTSTISSAAPTVSVPSSTPAAPTKTLTTNYCGTQEDITGLTAAEQEALRKSDCGT